MPRRVRRAIICLGCTLLCSSVRPTRRDLCSPGKRDSRLTWPCSGRGLPCRECHHPRGALLPHHFTLTLAGGMFSVALSVALPHPAVSRRPALWSSDFPRALTRDHPADWEEKSILYRAFWRSVALSKANKREPCPVIDVSNAVTHDDCLVCHRILVDLPGKVLVTLDHGFVRRFRVTVFLRFGGEYFCSRGLLHLESHLDLDSGCIAARNSALQPSARITIFWRTGKKLKSYSVRK